MSSTHLTIKNRHGVDLYATIEFPNNQKASEIAIFAHCFTCTSNINAVRNISRSLTQNGIAVVRFDFTGLGKSKGKFENSHFEANVEDLQDVHEYITKKYFAPSLIIGHSLGGLAAIVAASLIPTIKAVSTIGSPASIEHTTKHFKDQIQGLSEKGFTKVIIGGRDFTVNKKFVDGFNRHDVKNIITSLRKPLLIFHSPVDEIVGIENAKIIYENAKHPKSFVSLDKASHLLEDKSDSLYVGEIISTWVKKYLPNNDIKKLSPDDYQLVAKLNSEEGKFITTIKTESHGLIADEPISVGGTNIGMSPFELLASGLAACTAMTVNLYAQRKEWDLKEVLVYVDYEKVQSSDVFKKKIKLVGDLDEIKRKRLIENASKCPVHKTVLNGA